MKKAYNSKRKFYIFPGLLCICLIFFNISCGLDVLDAVLEDPFYTDDRPNVESEFDKRHFAFSTSKLDNSNSFGKGYVYYKIYNKASKKESEVNNIESMTSDSSRRYNAATTLINNYSYKELQYTSGLGQIVSPLTLDNVNQDIYIRLTNYVDTFIAQIRIDDKEVGIPLRYNGKTFDFGRTGEYDEKPVKANATEESSTDVRLFDSAGDGNGDTFYVVLYGVFSMPTDSFEKIIYSPVHYLGEVKIEATEQNN